MKVRVLTVKIVIDAKTDVDEALQQLTDDMPDWMVSLHLTSKGRVRKATREERESMGDCDL